MLAQAIIQTAMEAASEAEETHVYDTQLPAARAILDSSWQDWAAEDHDGYRYATLVLPGMGHLPEVGQIWENDHLWCDPNDPVPALIHDLNIDLDEVEYRAEAKDGDLVLEISGYPTDESDQIAEDQAIWQAGY